MNADRLLSFYDRVSEAPEAVDRLRRFVLDLAVRGKLVKQDPGDKPASELLKQIEAEMARLKVKNRLNPLTSQEIPFALPVGWDWSRIGELCRKTGSGSTPRGGKSVYRDSGIPFLRSQNVFDWGLRLDGVAYIGPEVHARMAGTTVHPGDLLLNITGGSMGRCARVPSEFSEGNVSQHVAIVRPAIPETADFLHKLILSPYFQKFIFGEQTGAGRGGLPKNRMDQIPVAVPSLAEQRRIVAKVDELMAVCDRLEEARITQEETREKLTKATFARVSTPDANSATFRSDARFTVNALPSLTARADQIRILRQAILDLAVRGKLVERNPRDEPTTELANRVVAEKRRKVMAGSFQVPRNALKIIRKDLPFVPPDHWRWARLVDIARVSYGFPFKSSQFNSQKHGMPLIRIRDISSTDTHAYFEGDYDRAYIVRAGDFLVGMDGRFDVCRWKGQDGLLNQRVMRINDWYGGIDPEFVKLPLQMVLEYIHRETSLTTVKHLSAKQVNGIEIPLAPLAEQRRIVAKVGELTTLCNRLEVGLHAAESNRRYLLDSVLHEALHDVA